MIDPTLILRDKKLLTRVQSLASNAVLKVLPDLSTTPRSDAGGVIRNVTVGTLDQFGTLATVTAAQSYKDMRASAAPTASELKIVPAYKPDEDVIETLVGYSMATFMKAPETVAETLSAAMGTAVANDYRKTGVDLGASDPIVVGYQRIASADACAFCLTVALNQFTSFEDDGGYHDHCSCTTVPVFKGDAPYRPDYYDEFQQIYDDNKTGNLNSYEIGGKTYSYTSTTAKDTFAAIRKATGRR